MFKSVLSTVKRIPWFLVVWFTVPLSIAILMMFGVFTQETVTGKIIARQVVEGDTYFVFQHDNGVIEVLRNDDNIFFGKTNSPEFDVNLQPSQLQRYEIKVNWVRGTVLSGLRNILSYRKLDQ